MATLNDTPVELPLAPCCLPGAAPDAGEEAAALAAAASPMIERLADGSRRLALVVENLDCAACLPEIERALAAKEGVTEARVNLTTRRLRLAWRDEQAALPDLLTAVLALGYRLAPFAAGGRSAALEAERRQLLRCLAVAGFAAGNVMLLSVSIWSGLVADMGVATRELLHWVSALIALPAVAYAGQPFFRSAAAALRAGRLNMDVPITLGVILASAISLSETIRGGPEAYFDAAVTLLFFLLAGRLLDQAMRGRVRSAAENLLALQAESALVILPDGRRLRRAVSELTPGALVSVAAGERVPVDGRVVSGHSELDTSPITGESLPRRAGPGETVHAGCLNLGGELQVSVAAAGERTLLSEVLRLVETAEQGRARYVRLADRVARWYSPAVHLLALAAFLLWLALGAEWQTALMVAVTVLIVTCPCALGLAVPAVQVAAVGRLFRQGILVRSADALERLATVDRVVLDKTGTLTLGRLEFENDPPVRPADLRLAAQLAAASRHPLARALVRAAGPVPLLPQPVREIAGAGLVVDLPPTAGLPSGEVRLGSARHCGVAAAEAAGDERPSLWLACPGRSPVAFRFRDRLRPRAAATLQRLRRDGLELELLSGDRVPVVARVAAEAGVPEWRAEVLPAAKRDRLAALQAQGHRVLMLGDGLNDAPALAAADASMSPAAASDVSQTAADLVFQGDSLAPVAIALETARLARRLVLQNFALAIGYNLVAVPVAFAGLVDPLLAAVFMSASSLAVTANALRAGRKVNS